MGETKLIKENSAYHYEHIAAIMNALSDVDHLKILNEAEKGFKSGKAIIKALDLSPRKYYRNLKKLNDTGIIEFFEDKYRLTSLGELLHKMLLVDISSLLIANQDFPEVMQKIGAKTELSVIDNYKNLIDLLVTAIEKSKNEILLATRYLDLAVIQSILFALDRNVRLKTITSIKIDFATFIKQWIGLLRNIRPSMIKSSFGAGSNYKVAAVPFSFIVIDQQISIFEIPNDKFKIAFVSTDQKTVKLLSELFAELWNQSQKLTLPTL